MQLRTRLAYTKNDQRVPDYTLLVSIGLLLFVGLLMLSSATSVIAFQQYSDSYAVVKMQLLKGILPGLIFFGIAYIIPYEKYKKFMTFFLIFSFLLLLIVFIPGAAIAVRGSVRSWINFGPVSFQTSEVAKITFILWMSAWISSRQALVNDPRRVLRDFITPFLSIVAAACFLLILQPDMGTMMLYAVTAFFMLCLSGVRFKYILMIILASMACVTLLILASPYRFQRLQTFWNPTEDIQGAGYQTHQALIAIGSGSWWGVGIGQSRQKLDYVPEVQNDAIFAIIGEEWGFIFSTLLLLLYAVLIIRGFAIARNAPDLFGGYTAFGITTIIATQIIVNISAMLGILPLTGLPLPLISQGGTNIAIILGSLGILANISKYSQHV